MILKCVGGPMDGAVYFVFETDDPEKQSTTRAPDGLWFDSQDEHGRPVQNQYKFDRDGLVVGHLATIYRYDGQVVDTGIEFETEPESNQ